MKFTRLSTLSACIFIVVSLLFQACNSPKVSPKTQIKSVASKQLSSIKHPISGIRYPASIHYAEGFSISYHGDYKLLKVFNPFVDQSDTLRYVLVPRGTEAPNIFKNAQVIVVPVRSLVVTGTSHVAFAAMLNATEVISGIGAAKYVYNPAVREKLKKGKIASLSTASLNIEKLVAMNPDLVMIGAGSVSSFNDYRLLMKMGIPVFVNADWLETTPLGRAEWVKVMGALLNKEERVNKKFKKVAVRYNDLKRQVAEKISANEKPLVINSLPYKGAWFVAGGDSYMAQYLKDAGANYPWFENNETGGLKLDFEAVYYQGLKADIWINPGRTKSITGLLMKDSRFADFKSVQTGQVYNKNKRSLPSGANDFWETGVVRPDLVLHDLINIFHPDLLKDDKLYFYQQLSRIYP